VVPGDFLVCTIEDNRTKEKIRFTEKIGHTTTVDTVVTFDVDEGDLGLESGFGAVFGKAR